MSPIKDLTGKRFERLTVVRRNGYLHKNHTAWLCLCDCGKKTTVRGEHLVCGNTNSCGCLRKETLAGNKRGATHRLSNHPLYRVWVYMNLRCDITKRHSETDKKYYIDRGITVCKEWHEFISFFEWAKDKWKDGLEIDRINTTGNYAPENCRFVTRKINAQNTRKSKRWYVVGVKYNSASDAAIAVGVSLATIRNWCLGHKRGKHNYPPKKECYAVRLYKNTGER